MVLAQYDPSITANYTLKAGDAYQYQFTYDNLDRILTGNLQKRLATGSSFADYFKLNGMSYESSATPGR